jgi:hypothetical protein
MYTCTRVPPIVETRKANATAIDPKMATKKALKPH